MMFPCDESAPGTFVTAAVVAAIALTSTPNAPAQSLPTFVAENATYRYINATPATNMGAPPPSWFQPSFDDSSWFVGQGAFGTSFGMDMGNATGPQAPAPMPNPGGTQWDVFFDPYLRTEFVLPAPMNLTVWIAVDNGINSFYLNGISTTQSFNAEGAAIRWEHVFDIPAAFTVAGTNVVALQLEDHGVATGFAMAITADDVATNPLFSNQCPAGATFDNYGTGFAGAGGFVPQLTVSQGLPVLGGSTTIFIENSNGVPKVCCVLFGLQPAALSFSAIGGAVLVDPFGPGFGMVETPLGVVGTSLTVNYAAGATTLCGLDIYMQAIQWDAAVPGDYAFSRGLRLTIGS